MPAETDGRISHCASTKLLPCAIPNDRYCRPRFFIINLALLFISSTALLLIVAFAPGRMHRYECHHCPLLVIQPIHYSCEGPAILCSSIRHSTKREGSGTKHGKTKEEKQEGLSHYCCGLAPIQPRYPHVRTRFWKSVSFHHPRGFPFLPFFSFLLLDRSLTWKDGMEWIIMAGTAASQNEAYFYGVGHCLCLLAG